MTPLAALLSDIKACTICKDVLPFAPNPVLRVQETSKILIIGQAPGLRVQLTNLSWNDRSGDELRRWLGVSRTQFYDTDIFSIMPLGFCYPGRGTHGDLPPRPECAPAWHRRVLALLPDISLVLLIGQYAQRYYLGKTAYPTLTETVSKAEQYLPLYFPLVHPSPRNKRWHIKNPWFATDTIPLLQSVVQPYLSS
ncbi:MAG: uracil-DNA glycosylase family protein [Sphingobacteriales bacterium]|nr:uracil-DNA glycosylase family protein [Sphingobacteriales bacterium]